MAVTTVEDNLSKLQKAYGLLEEVCDEGSELSDIALNEGSIRGEHANIILERLDTFLLQFKEDIKVLEELVGALNESWFPYE